MSASRQAVEHLDGLVVAADDEHVRVEDAAVQAGALEQAAGQREDARPPGGRLVPAAGAAAAGSTPRAGQQAVRLLAA